MCAHACAHACVRVDVCIGYTHIHPYNVLQGAANAPIGCTKKWRTRELTHVQLSRVCTHFMNTHRCVTCAFRPMAPCWHRDPTMRPCACGTWPMATKLKRLSATIMPSPVSTTLVTVPWSSPLGVCGVCVCACVYIAWLLTVGMWCFHVFSRRPMCVQDIADLCRWSVGYIPKYFYPTLIMACAYMPWPAIPSTLLLLLLPLLSLSPPSPLLLPPPVWMGRSNCGTPLRRGADQNHFSTSLQTSGRKSSRNWPRLSAIRTA